MNTPSIRAHFLRRAPCLAVLLVACNGNSPTRDGGPDVTAMDVTTDASDTVPTDATDALPPDAALPDLSIDEAVLRDNVQFAVQYFRPDACEIGEQCVGAPGWRRLLMFTSLTPNLGTGDLNLGPASPTNPNFEYSQCHHHYHFLGYANYTLLTPDGGVGAMGHKQSFCVEDLEQYITDSTVRTTPQFNFCGTGANGAQGISAGWADDYYPDLPCQWIDVTDVPPGNYTLEVAINYEHRIVESDYTNNTAQVPVTIPADFTTGNPLQACTTGNEQGIGRDCGWAVEGTHTCNPGDTVSVGCSATCGLGSCTGSWDLRLCEGSHACRGGDLQHVLQQDFGECSQGVFDLASTCPVATFTCPASGQYTVMSAADVPGDTMSSCQLQTRVVAPGGDGGMSTDGGASTDASDAATPGDGG